MRQINIPFREDEAQRVVEGRKVRTTRQRAYGDVGDIFSVTYDTVTKRYVLTAVEKERLGDVAEQHYSEEGYGSTQEFIDVWSSLYERDGWTPDATKIAMTFEEVKPPQIQVAQEQTQQV